MTWRSLGKNDASIENRSHQMNFDRRPGKGSLKKRRVMQTGGNQTIMGIFGTAPAI